jgi:hypothetical protein
MFVITITAVMGLTAVTPVMTVLLIGSNHKLQRN